MRKIFKLFLACGLSIMANNLLAACPSIQQAINQTGALTGLTSPVTINMPDGSTAYHYIGHATLDNATLDYYTQNKPTVVDPLTQVKLLEAAYVAGVQLSSNQVTANSNATTCVYLGAMDGVTPQFSSPWNQVIVITSTPSIISLDTKIQNSIDQFVVTNSAKYGFTAYEVSVLLPGQTEPRNYVSGTQSKEIGNPATTDMLMQWASITKEFTNVLLVKYLYKHGLTIDYLRHTTLLQLFPEKFSARTWPATWAPVTLEQLMNMTSGIGSYDYPFLTFDPNLNWSIDQIIQKAADYQNKNGCILAGIGCFTPAGTHYFYSNTNYFILGLVIEKFYQQDFLEVMNQQIITPMRNAGNSVYEIVNYNYPSNYPPDILQNMINAYSYFDVSQIPDGVFLNIKNGENTTNINLTMGRCSGSLTGSTAALTQMAYALFNSNENFLTPAQTNLFITTGLVKVLNFQDPESGKPVAYQNIAAECGTDGCYGHGVMVYYQLPYGEYWTYGGASLGHATTYFYFPSNKLVVVTAQNAIVQGSEDYNIVSTAEQQQLLQYVWNYLYPTTVKN